MSGFKPYADPDSVAPECVLALAALPVAAAIFESGSLRCVATNPQLESLTGIAAANLAGCAFGELVADPCDLHELAGCRNVCLLGANNQRIMATALLLPVTQAGKPCLLCVLVERIEGWRAADLAHAIDAVMHDEMQWFSSAVLERLARLRVATGTRASLGHLTPRERQILKLVCEGRDDAEIAMELAIARNTLRNHLSNIYGKAGVRRRSEAVVWGRERGIMTA